MHQRFEVVGRRAAVDFAASAARAARVGIEADDVDAARASRRAMLPPMRPNPTIPICKLIAILPDSSIGAMLHNRRRRRYVCGALKVAHKAAPTMSAPTGQWSRGFGISPSNSAASAMP